MARVHAARQEKVGWGYKIARRTDCPPPPAPRRGPAAGPADPEKQQPFFVCSHKNGSVRTAAVAAHHPLGTGASSMRGWLFAALLTSLAVGVAQDCALSEDSSTEPDSSAELRSRFASSFTEYSEGEVAAARLARNKMRVAAPRILADAELFGAELQLSTRFCGLRYGNSSRDPSVSCQPDSAEALGSQRFLAACYDTAPAGCVDSCCSVEDLGPDELDLPKYVISVGPTLAGAVALALVWEALCLLWFLSRRWCGMFGGRTPSSKCQCPCFGKHFAGYGTVHMGIFRGMAALYCCSTLVSAIISLIGNARVSSGLSSATDILQYELGQLADNFDATLLRVAKGGGGPSAVPSATMLSVAADFRCQVAGMQGEVDSSGGSALLIRAILAPTLAVVPVLIAGAGFFAALNNRSQLIGNVSVGLVPAVFLVFLSSGMHMLIAVILGDLCTEIDLVLHTPKGEAVSLPFLPADPPLLPCGGDNGNGLSKLEDELLRQMQPALDFVANQIRQACNYEEEFEGFQFANLNCTGVAGTLLQGGSGLDRSGPGPPYSAGRYSAGNIEHALVAITLGDPGIAVDADGVDTQGGFCVISAEKVAASEGSAVCGLEEAAVSTCQPPTAWLNAASRGRRQEQVALETRRTLGDCGSVGPHGCKLPLLQSLACRIASEKNVMLTRARELAQLNAHTIEPLGRCEFIHEIFAPVFMAVCVDGLSGLRLLDFAGKLCGGTLLLMIPYTVMATKRLDEKNQRGIVGKVSPDGGGAGVDDDRFAAPVDNNLLDFSADGGALVVRPSEGERTLLVNGPVMKSGRHFCEFTLVKTHFDFIIGLARPSFKPSGNAGGVSVSASVKKGKGLGWGLRTHSGALCHAGRGRSWEGQAKMPQGSRVGLLLDLGEGSLTCYLDGRKLGSVIPATADDDDLPGGGGGGGGGGGVGLEAPLVWMCELLSEGDAVRIERVQPPVGFPERFEHEP